MLQLTVEQDAFDRVLFAVSQEADGKRLKRELVRNMRDAIEPALDEIRGDLMSMATPGGFETSPALRTSVLNQLETAVRTSGGSPGVRVRIKRRGMPRGFDDAARALNRDGGWSHPAWGRSGTSVEQVGVPGYFDRPLEARADELRAAVADALQEMAERIARRM
jgi:hypothetical protein